MSGPWEEYQTQEDGPWSEYKKEGEKAPAPQSTPLSSVPGQALENLPGSAVRFGENIASAVVHPIETVKNISKIGAGGIEKAVGMVTDKFGKGQEEPAFDAFTKSIGDRYGGWENVKHTMATDPVGFMADISALLSGGATAAGKAGLPEAAAAARTGAEFTNPVSLTTKGVAAGANALSKTNWPETIMARTAKIPPGSLRDRERERVLRTLVRDEKIPLGRKTVSEMSTAIGELETGIDDAIKLATQRGAKADVTRVTAELETLKNKYKNRPDPEAYYNAIDAVKKDLIDHNFNDRMQITTNVPVQSPILGPNGQPMMTTKPVTANVPTGEMNLDRAHQLKKGIYQEVQDYYMKQQKPETGRVGIQNDVEAKAKAAAAAVLRDEVLNNPSIPGKVRDAMKREAGLMNARKWVERATNRGGNLDPVGIAGMMFGIMVEGGLPAATAYRVAVSQPVMSRFAIALGKSNRAGIGAAVPNALYQAGRASGAVEGAQ